MKVVCVDDHSVMLKGTKQSVEQILPEASIVAFANANEALAFVKENGCLFLRSILWSFPSFFHVLRRNVREVLDLLGEG